MEQAQAARASCKHLFAPRRTGGMSRSDQGIPDRGNAGSRIGTSEDHPSTHWGEKRMLRGDAATVHSVSGVLGVGMLIPPKIPPNIDANWHQFVTEWCLGVEPDETPSEVERAFDALRRFWPEVVEELEMQGAQGHSGISMVVSAVARGRTLAACERLDGFGDRECGPGSTSAVVRSREEPRAQSPYPV